MIDEGPVTRFPTTHPYRGISRLPAFCGECIDDLVLVALIFLPWVIRSWAAVFEYSDDSEG